MSKSTVLFILSIFIGNILFSQSKISGTITDAFTKEPVPGAVVYVYNGNKLLGYTVADSKGNYSIVPNGEFTHLIFYQMGYTQNKLTFSSKPLHDIIKDISLAESVQMLKSITVKPIAVKVNADTVTYDASLFKKREDKTLAQILDRLPNVKVMSNGGIKINGQQINKLYIEDMDLLGGRYGIAVRNIRADDIASINVYHNHQPVKALKQVEISNQHAINIKLKEKAKSKWLIAMGLQLGVSLEEELLYSAKINAMNFSSKRQTIVTAKTDNTGEDIITETALQNIKPGVYSLDELSHGIKDLFHIPSAVVPIDKNLYYNNNSNAVTVSNLKKINTENNIKGTLIFTTDRTNDNIDINKVFFPINEEKIYISDSSQLQRNNVDVSGDITYTSNKDKKYFENIFKFKVFLDNASGKIWGSSNNYTQNYKLPKFSFANDIEMISSKSGNKAFRLNAQLRFTNQDQQMAVKHKEPIQGYNTESLIQNINAKSFEGDIYTKFSRRKHNATYSITPGIRLSYNRYNSEFEPFSDTTLNNISLLSLQPYIRPEFVFTSRKLNINLNIPLSLRFDMLTSENNIYLLYSPLFALKYKLWSDLSFNLRGTANNNIGGIEYMARNYIYTGYRDFRAYKDLEKRNSFNFSGGLSYNNLGNFFSGSITGIYSGTNSNLMPWETVLQDFTYMVYDSGNNHNRQKSLVINAKKLFGINKFSIEGNITLSKDNAQQYLQGELYEHNTKGISGDINLQFSPSNTVTFTYKGNYSTNKFTGESNTSKIDSYSNKGAIVIFPTKELEIKASINHFTQKLGNSENVSLMFINFSSQYKFSKKLAAWIKLQNVTNEKYYQYTYYNNVTTVTRRVALRGAEYLCGISLDF